MGYTNIALLITAVSANKEHQAEQLYGQLRNARPSTRQFARPQIDNELIGFDDEDEEVAYANLMAVEPRPSTREFARPQIDNELIGFDDEDEEVAYANLMAVEPRPSTREFARPKVFSRSSFNASSYSNIGGEEHASFRLGEDVNDNGHYEALRGAGENADGMWDLMKAHASNEYFDNLEFYRKMIDDEYASAKNMAALKNADKLARDHRAYYNDMRDLNQFEEEGAAEYLGMSNKMLDIENDLVESFDDRMGSLAVNVSHERLRPSPVKMFRGEAQEAQEAQVELVDIETTAGSTPETRVDRVVTPVGNLAGYTSGALPTYSGIALSGLIALLI